MSVLAAAALAAASVGAAPALVVDKAAHSVTFTATASEVAPGTPLEFFFIGPDSDRAYEGMFVTDARVKDIADAFAAAGIPRGTYVDAARCMFWPAGPRVAVTPGVWEFVEDVRGGSQRLPAVYTGGMRDASGMPDAETNMPSAVFAFYSCPQSLLLLDDALDQSVAYGRFVPKAGLEKGARRTFTISWDGVSGTKPYALDLRPGALKEGLEAMRAASCGTNLEVTVSFSPELTVREATMAANALAVLDSRAVRINGAKEGQFFYRAFLPLEKWRDRKERLSQPLEVRLVGDGVEYTVVDEDWSGEGLDPVLTPRKVLLGEAAKTKADTCFIYASGDAALRRVYEARLGLPRTLRNWYVYMD